MAPASFEDIVKLQHGHVAAHAVAMLRDAGEAGKVRGAHAGMEMIELGDVEPRGKIRVLGASEEASASRRVEAIEEGGIPLEILLRALDVKFGMRARPGVVEGGVVADEI
jgi:hypothetical protein